MTNNLIKEHKGLVVSMAKRYQGKGLDLEDLVQEGYIGLLTAQKKYKEDKGTKFSTYASYWIKQAIIRAIENTGSLIRVPSYANDLLSPDHVNISDNTATSIGTRIDATFLVTQIRDIIGDDTSTHMYLSYYMHNMSYRDIASQFSISHETARKQLNKLHTLVQSKLLK